MLGILEQTSLDEMTVQLDAAIESLLRDRYSKEKDLAKILNESRQRLYAAGAPTAFYQRILALANQIDGADFDALMPFLEACDEMWPYSESVSPYDISDHPNVRSTQELLMLAVAEGSMHEYFKPHPEVEQWISGMADRVREVIRSYDSVDGTARLPLVLGTAVALHDLMAGLAPYFQRVHDKQQHKEFSFVAHVIGDIRRALLWTILRDLWPEEAGAVGPQTPARSDGFSMPRVKQFALPSRAAFKFIRCFLQRLAEDEEDLAEIAATLDGFDLLPKLVDALRTCPFASGKDAARKGSDKVLPFGQFALVQTYGPRGEQVLYYTVDGIGHHTHLAIRSPDPALGTTAEMVPLLPADGGFNWEGVLACRLDDRGKVYMGRVDRLAPPLANEEYEEATRIIGRVDAACHQTLLQEWENLPELFARLDTLGPVVLVRTQNASILLCRSAVLQEIQAFRSWKPQSENETRALCERIHMQGQGAWGGLILKQRGAVIPESRSVDMRKVWRAKIRKQMEHERIPNFRRLVEKLAPFGVQETTRGKGSHGTLRLQGDTQERNQTTWYALRHKAEPLPIPYVWECLERLGIGYQDFYKSLGGD
jgi:hypothetical protein